MELLGTLVLLAMIGGIFYLMFKISLPVFTLAVKFLPAVAGIFIGIVVWQAGFDNLAVLIMLASIIGNIIWRKYWGQGSGRLK